MSVRVCVCECVCVCVGGEGSVVEVKRRKNDGWLQLVRDVIGEGCGQREVREGW